MPSLGRSAAVSLLFTVLGGPALVLVLLPWTITRIRVAAGEPRAQVIAAAAIIGLGLIPLFESMIRFVVIGRGTLVPAVPTEHLVVSGLYRYVRNPMYSGVVTALAGEALLFPSRHMVVYLATVWVIMHIFVWLYEEPTLARKYGEEYDGFKRNVPRWIPRIKPWNAREAKSPEKNIRGSG